MDMKADQAIQVNWPDESYVIPRNIFEREDVYQEELNRIFHGPVWHPVVHDAELPQRHDFKTVTLGDRPILLMRSEAGEVRAFINACTHRGVMVATGFSGNAAQHVCPYHGWTFDSAGALRACPGEEDFVPGFDRADHGLPRVRIESLWGLHFITLDDAAPPLEAFLAGMDETMRRILGGDGRLRLLGYQKVQFDVNWKAYFDQDGWHAPMLHAAFRMLELRAERGVLKGTRRGHRNINYGMVPVTKTDLLQDISVIEYRHQPEDGGQLALLFPTFNMNKQMDIMTVRYATPRGPAKTEVHYAYFAHQDDDEETYRHRLRQSSNLLGPSGFINLEDGAVFHRIQQATSGGGHNYMVKGMHPGADVYTDSVQNDEMQSMVFWNAYREVMGFPA